MKTIPALLFLVFTLQPAWGADVSDTTATAKAAVELNLPAAGEADGIQVALRIGNRRIKVEVASTPQSREQGLMQRSSLCDDCGMLFVFEKADKYSFWMKDTLLPLSVAFIDTAGEIINIEEMEANTIASHEAQGEALYALEMNGDWFAINGVAPRTRVRGVTRATK